MPTSVGYADQVVHCLSKKTYESLVVDGREREMLCNITSIIRAEFVHKAFLKG